MFLIAGTAFLVLLSLTLVMLWGHERMSNKRIVPRARVEEYWIGEERREHKRFKKELDIEYSVEKKPRLNKGMTGNISKGGMKILLDEKLPKGAILDLKAYIPGMKQPVEVEAEVVWTSDSEKKDPSGKRFFHSGIKYIAIKEPSEARFFEYIASLENA